MEFVLQFAGEIGPHLQFLKEKSPRRRILEPLPKLGKAFVSVSQGLDQVIERLFHISQINVFGHPCLLSSSGMRGVERRLPVPGG
jgi:hypothetical protein